jgi:hypothetical protein
VAIAGALPNLFQRNVPVTGRPILYLPSSETGRSAPQGKGHMRDDLQVIPRLVTPPPRQSAKLILIYLSWVNRILSRRTSWGDVPEISIYLSGMSPYGQMKTFASDMNMGAVDLDRFP